MNLPFLFARRYLLAKRSQNAINIITFISIVVISVVTAAMVVVLSTLNGIAELVDSIYSPFDQDITITPALGKTLPRETLDLGALLALPQVDTASWVIEENVLLRSGEQQAVATLKGIEPQYLEMSRMEKHMFTGDAKLEGPTGPTAILGIGLKVDLDVPLDDGVFTPLEISAPIRGRKLSRYQQQAFDRTAVAVSGAYSMNLEFDAKYAVVPIDLAADLLQYDSLVSAVEIQLAPETNLDRTADQIRSMIGKDFLVRTRYQKNALMYQTNASEKFFTFIVLSFIGLIGAFNIIASLTMMMIEKKLDMRTLMSMGATPATIRSVFFHEGMLIVAVGTTAGVLLGLLICFLQQTFGFVQLEGSVVEAYPVKIIATDLILIFITVITIGVLASWVPLRDLSSRFLHATAPKA
ncbi:MAG: FtsX-like permease family protein [Bacteroidota bacterium]|nr:FtsX-like permease family protein [Bacteroidota bacterium]